MVWCGVQVGLVAAAIPASGLADVLSALGDLLQSSPFLEFLLAWTAAVCTHHSSALQAACQAAPWHGRGMTSSGIMSSGAGPGQGVLPALRALNRTVGKLHEDLVQAAEANLFSLQYLAAAGGLSRRTAGAALVQEERTEV